MQPYYRATIAAPGGVVSITEDDLYARSEAFGTILAEDEAGRLLSFVVGLGDGEYGVDFAHSQLIVNGERYDFAAPATPRLVYYKRMQATSGFEAVRIERIAVGWQATVKDDGEWRNVRLGIVLLPDERKWEVTGDF